MNESEFFNQVSSNGHVWVAMKSGSVVSFGASEGGVALPIWNSMENAQEFLSNVSSLYSCQAVEVPLEVFKVAWLSGSSMSVGELIINPNGLKPKDVVLSK